MSQLSLAFLVAAVVAAGIGFGGVAGEAVGEHAGVAKVLSVAFAVLSVGFFVASRRKTPGVVDR